MKIKGRASAMPMGLAAGLAAALTITLAASALTAWMIRSGQIPESSVGYAALAILAAASITGPVVAWNMIRHNRMLTCAISGSLYYLTLLAVTGLCFGGQYQGMGVTGLVVLGCSCGTGLAGLSGKRHKRIRRPKLR